MPRRNSPEGAAAKRAYFREYYARNRDRIISRTTARNRQHREAINTRARTYYAAKYRAKKFQTLYHLTPEQFTRLDAVTACEICGRSGALDFDHCHKSHVARGRLCGACNKGIGLFRDSVETLASAIQYLKRTA